MSGYVRIRMKLRIERAIRVHPPGFGGRTDPDYWLRRQDNQCWTGNLVLPDGWMRATSPSRIHEVLVNHLVVVR